MDYSQSYITRNPEKENGRIIQSACLSVFANPQNVVHRDHWLVVMCPKGDAIMISGFTRRGLKTTQHTKCTRRWLVAPKTVRKRKSGENNNKNGRRIGEERLWKCMQYDTVEVNLQSLLIFERPSRDAPQPVMRSVPLRRRDARQPLKTCGLYMDMPFD
jgi:hypothetical protein